MREDMKYKIKCAEKHLLLTGSHWKQHLADGKRDMRDLELRDYQSVWYDQ